jgi:predicted ribosome quality control (RQC) complex YloA/Tae2 family protein
MKIKNIFITENDKEYQILIGRNKIENEQIIKSSYSNDIWFHLNDFSSCHIVLKSGDDNIPKKYLTHIAKMFSLYKKGLPNNYKVIYTNIKNIKLTNEIGTVIPQNSKIIKI